MAKHLANSIVLGTALATAIAAPGCAIGTIIGGMAESYRESSTQTIQAEYTGLNGQSFAVLVNADRTTHADFPNLAPVLTTRISDRLYQHTGATGWVPPESLLAWLYDNPRWVSTPAPELAKELGVDQLVVIDLFEFRLNEPGNRYVWDGRAAGTLSVVGGLGETPTFVREIDVSFPDSDGFGPNELSAEQVASVLMARFVDRSSWLFYDHEEPYYPDY
ncbi:MAG: hypothetical protein AAGK04_02170 [Planctomycetota bacterium]